MDGFNARWWKGKRIYWEKYKSEATGWIEVWCGVEGWKKKELYKTSQFESSNKQTEMKNWMEEKSECCSVCLPLPNFYTWWFITQLHTVMDRNFFSFLSLLFCVLLRAREWKRWNVKMVERGAFRPKTVDVQQKRKKNKKDDTN